MIIKHVDAFYNECLDEDYIACIGYFDGLHKGHQLLFDTVFSLVESNTKSACICFDKDPYTLFHKDYNGVYLTPDKHRLQELEQLGFDVCFLLTFDTNMASLSIAKFNELLIKLNIKQLVCGDDFHYAYKGEGNIHTLKESGIIIHRVPLLKIDDVKVSSSIIEQQILNGDIEKANVGLGYVYEIRGTVIHGANVGEKKLGFPTANLFLKENYIIPKKGVYGGSVQIDNDVFFAMINVGNNPTMNYKEEISVEAHLLDFNKDIYGQEITVLFESFIRDEQKFESIEALVQQLELDVSYVRGEKR